MVSTNWRGSKSAAHVLLNRLLAAARVGLDIIEGKTKNVPSVQSQHVLPVKLVSELSAVEILRMGRVSIDFNGQLETSA